MFLQGMWTSIRIVLFFIVMLAVAWVVPYEDFVDTFIYTHISYADAGKIAKLVLGEPDPEPYDSISDYISLVINTLISVPLMGVIISAYNAITRKTKPAELPKEWALSTLRRFGKIALFTFLFWALLRLLPWQTLFPDDQSFTAFSAIAFLVFNMFLTSICYWFIMKKFTNKRRFYHG
ncbi:hypothetical protein [Leclercia tamurae]|uniref:Uncharacterized protein n=1 Tax=Leclercia tamurae TaxID=2926467 RepID=A0ABT2RBT0_9ENTR|nr:hypothetical protein [Leclercia tamurae]MCU6678349.1 hypothetical protein [Leclercia tamurae]